MQAASAERRRWRVEYVRSFLDQIGVAPEALATSTRKCLDDWAKQVQLVEQQPNASLGNAVLHLCKAVECEVAAGLGTIDSLEFLAGSSALGQKAMFLQQMTLGDSAKQQLASRGLQSAFVSSTLAQLLSQLAYLRSDTDSAHGGAQIRTAGMQDASRARQLTRQILGGIVRASSKGSK